MTQDLVSAASRPFYPFTVGSFNCLAISDGFYTYRLDEFFANVSKEQLNRALGPSELVTHTITSPYTCLYVDDGLHHILVDAGAGSLIPTAGQLRANMKSAGLHPAGIDTLIITHAHPDHIGGLLDERGRPLFPKAHYYLWRAEHDFWFSDIAFEQAPRGFVDLARSHVRAIRSRLDLIDRELEIHAGIRVLAAFGHTPGHMALAIESGADRLLHVSDAALSPYHLQHPTWRPLFDIQPEKAAASKRRLFDRAAAENALVFAHHFPPFPALGYITKVEDGWRWRPIVT